MYPTWFLKSDESAKNVRSVGSVNFAGSPNMTNTTTLAQDIVGTTNM